MRQEGLSYKDIKEYFENKGIKVGYDEIQERCKKIYEERGKEEPKLKIKEETQKTQEIPNEEEFIKLVEQGLTARKIKIYYEEEKGINVDLRIIISKMKLFYEQKMEKRIADTEKTEITDEEIFNLREQHLSYKEIVEYFKNRGIVVGIQIISQRCKKIYEERGKVEPKVQLKSKVDAVEEEIYNLREQGLNYKEIERYLEKNGIQIDYTTIRKKE